MLEVKSDFKLIYFLSFIEDYNSIEGNTIYPISFYETSYLTQRICLISALPSILTYISTFNNKNQNYHYFLFEFYSPKLPKSNVSPENILYIETNLFVVSQKSRQHSTRGRQGGDQGRRGDKPTRGLWELTDDIGEWCWWTMSDGKCILITIIIY